MNVRRRVLIVVPRLVAGGSEKVLSTIAGNLDRERFEVHLAVLGDVKAAERAAVAAHVVVHELGLRHARYAGIGLLRLIWRLRPRDRARGRRTSRSARDTSSESRTSRY